MVQFVRSGTMVRKGHPLDHSGDRCAACGMSTKEIDDSNKPCPGERTPEGERLPIDPK